jgi:hypothetical protein
VRKIADIDLLDIADAKGTARRQPGRRFTFPFVTIENVDVLDDWHVAAGYDNHLPFSAERFVDRADASELIVLDVGDFLQRM